MSYRDCLPAALADTLPLGIFQKYRGEDLLTYIAACFNNIAESTIKERVAKFADLVFELTRLPSSPFLRDLLISCTKDPRINWRGSFFSAIATEKFIQGDHKFISIMEELKGVEPIGIRVASGALFGAVIMDNVDLAKRVVNEPDLVQHSGSWPIIFAVVNRNREMIELLLETGHRIPEHSTNILIWRSEAMDLLNGELHEYRDRIIDPETIEFM